MLNSIKFIKKYRRLLFPETKAATRRKAETPWLFDEVRPPKGAYIVVPAVSSGRRKYVPMGFVTDGMVSGNKLYYIDGAGLWEFGVLMSRFHNAWMRTVAGRLKSDYNCANTIVYNNFVWPDCGEAAKERVRETAQGILDA